MIKDVLGHAMYDYYTGASQDKLWIHNKYGAKERMPVQIYFRNADKMPQLELLAIENCIGKTLDIGAGAGSHALLLQEKKIDVTALDISPKAALVMQLRGVHNVWQHNIFDLAKGNFDTLLLLMNGIGLTGTITGLHNFLLHAKNLLNPYGQLLFDSCNVAYLYEGKAKPANNYYGEVDYRYEYCKEMTSWFKWLYIDKDLLIKIAKAEGYKVKILFEDTHDQYLAKLML